MGNGQKRELPVLFWPKTGVPENNSGTECCWTYLIGQHPISTVFGQKRPGALGYSYFAQLFAILCSFPMGYSATLTDQHGSQERKKTVWDAQKVYCRYVHFFFKQLTEKFRAGDVEIGNFYLRVCKKF